MLYVWLVSCAQYTNCHFILACFWCLSVYIILSVCLVFLFYGHWLWNKLIHSSPSIRLSVHTGPDCVIAVSQCHCGARQLLRRCVSSCPWSSQVLSCVQMFIASRMHQAGSCYRLTKSILSVFSTSLQLLIPLITTYCSLVCHPGSAFRALL